MSRETTIFPGREFFDFKEWRTFEEFNEVISEVRDEFNKEVSMLKVFVMSPPQVLLTRAQSAGKSYEKFISDKVDDVIGELSELNAKILRYGWLQMEFHHYDAKKTEEWRKSAEQGKETEYISKCWDFKPVYDDQGEPVGEENGGFEPLFGEKGELLNYEDDHRPSISLCNTYYPSRGSITEAIANATERLEIVATRIKMWAASDITALAKAGMEAKDKTEYTDDKFSYTDVVSQVSSELSDEMELIEDELDTITYASIIERYFDTANYSY